VTCLFPDFQPRYQVISKQERLRRAFVLHSSTCCWTMPLRMLNRD
jgi:hypothetical protein